MDKFCWHHFFFQIQLSFEKIKKLATLISALVHFDFGQKTLQISGSVKFEYIHHLPDPLRGEWDF